MASEEGMERFAVSTEEAKKERSLEREKRKAFFVSFQSFVSDRTRQRLIDVRANCRGVNRLKRGDTGDVHRVVGPFY